MPWYVTASIVAGGSIYLVGYFWCAPKVYHSCMDDHPMRHSSDEGFYPAFFMGFLWPIMALGVVIKRLVRQFWPSSELAKKLAKVDDTAMMIDIIMTVVVAVCVVGVIIEVI